MGSVWSTTSRTWVNDATACCRFLCWVFDSLKLFPVSENLLRKRFAAYFFLLIYEHLLKYWLWMANPVAVTALLLTWGSFVHPCTYDEYFGKKICTVGSKVLEEIDLARGYTQLPMRVSYPINPCAYCLKFLKRSPGCATGFPDTGQTITVRAVTSLLCWSSLSFINLHRSQFMKNS